MSWKSIFSPTKSNLILVLSCNHLVIAFSSFLSLFFSSSFIPLLSLTNNHTFEGGDSLITKRERIPDGRNRYVNNIDMTMKKRKKKGTRRKNFVEKGREWWERKKKNWKTRGRISFLYSSLYLFPLFSLFWEWEKEEKKEKERRKSERMKKHFFIFCSLINFFLLHLVISWQVSSSSRYFSSFSFILSSTHEKYLLHFVPTSHFFPLSLPFFFFPSLFFLTLFLLSSSNPLSFEKQLKSNQE